MDGICFWLLLLCALQSTLCFFMKKSCMISSMKSELSGLISSIGLLVSILLKLHSVLFFVWMVAHHGLEKPSWLFICYSGVLLYIQLHWALMQVLYIAINMDYQSWTQSAKNPNARFGILWKQTASSLSGFNSFKCYFSLWL